MSAAALEQRELQSHIGCSWQVSGSPIGLVLYGAKGAKKTIVSSKQLRTLKVEQRAVGSAFQATPALRQRVADRVFNELLGAILRGELKPGEAVPPQRDLSVQFGVSPLIVRQAIHRLEELELVRVRQGSTTIVLDPNEASDVRLIQLQLEVSQPGDALALAGVENRSALALPLLVLAERRISAREVRELEELLDALSEAPTPEEMSRFAQQFWPRIAAATRNPLLRHQVRWWFRVTETFRPKETAPHTLSPQVYRRLVDALRAHHGVAEIWFKVIHAVCDWTEAQPRHTVAVERASRPAPAKRSPARTRSRTARSRASKPRTR